MTYRPASICACLLLLAAASAPVCASSYVLFESGPVRPLALSPDGSRLFVTNVPDNRLEVFDVNSDGLVHSASVPVGLEPVAVAARSNDEVWVVNHLSDSVSIVSLDGVPRVTRTLLVGDEPRGLVFAHGGDRAFVATARRGQHRTHPSIAAVPGAGDPLLTTPSVPRADVWVFDASDPGAGLGGTPLKIIELFGDTPRALAVSPDGSTVYAAVFNSGNQTAVVSEGMVCNGFGGGACAGDGITSPNGLAGGQLPGGSPGPDTNVELADAPEVGLIVRYDEASGEWRDELDRNWSNGIRFTLPDLDVFAIDAATLNQTASYAHVGTTLFNMAVNPVDGTLYVSNTDARNEVRFEGPGTFGGTTVQGHLAEARITVISGNSVAPRHLNKHIDYDILPAPAGTSDHSLATPLQMAISSSGTTLYVAALGSDRIGVFDTASLENDSFDPTTASAAYVDVSGGPAGVVLDEVHDRLYVLTRYDNAVAIVDLGDAEASRAAVARRIALHNPEPAAIVSGRPFLYDANLSSSNGEASCASCHIFGDMDHLAWDLGNPDGEVKTNPIPIKLDFAAGGNINGTGNVDDFHPMKGPMTTQTFRGMTFSGAMHWRGDRAVGQFGTDPFSSQLSFMNFNEAFPGLLGRAELLSGSQMTLFTNFTLELTMPPNPIRPLDNTLTPAQQRGRDLYVSSRRMDGSPIDFGGNQTGFTCEGCHRLSAADGFFGTGGEASFENEEQIMKIPHLRNMYQKVGMFGMPDISFINGGDNAHKGAQVRGTGFLHDGSFDTLFRFFQATVFNLLTSPFGDIGFVDDDVRRDMEAFMLAFDSDLAPIVGQQITLGATAARGGQGEDQRVDLLLARADASFVSLRLGGEVTEADIAVKGIVGGEARGWQRLSDGSFRSDRAAETPLSEQALRALADVPGQELTFLALPPGSAYRAGIDRDEDGVLDGDDVCPAVADAAQTDSDGDGVGDACDSCTLLADATQRDSNGDGYGNVCDADLDNDGVINFSDLALLKGEFFGAGDLDADFNGDQVVNFSDLAILKDAFFGSPGPSALRP